MTMKMKIERGLPILDGLLSIKDEMHGDDAWWGRLIISEADLIRDVEEGTGLLKIPPAGLFALRDFLNRILPDAAPTACVAPAPSAQKSE